MKAYSDYDRKQITVSRLTCDYENKKEDENLYYHMGSLWGVNEALQYIKNAFMGDILLYWGATIYEKTTEEIPFDFRQTLIDKINEIDKDLSTDF